MQTSPKPKPSQPCPCGSGKKFRDCCALKQQQRRKVVRQSKQVLKWAGVVAVVVAILYAMSQSSWVPYDEDDMAAVDFSSLDSSDRRTAVREANEARCPCGCGMTLARCVATDSTCPLRNQNIERINVMVKAAAND